MTDPAIPLVDVPIIDAHVHLWDRSRLRYPWLEQADMAAIAGDYGIDDYLRETAGWPVRGMVHVDAGAHPDQGQAETAWLESLRAGHGLPHAIVARVELHAPDAERQLAWQAERAAVRGIRHLVNWHPDPARQAYSIDLTDDPAWKRGYARLARHGLSFDFHGFPPQLANLARIAAGHPDVPLVINHLGLPILADGLETWREGLRALAELPHAAIKLSGAGFIASPFAPAQFADLILEVIDLFGPARVMAASNFPTDRLFASLDRTFSAYAAIIARFDLAGRRAMWGGTANRFYRLGLSL
ncbi:amidohydrolase [Novosphingobium sp.]|uniref:amidohydrolase family protein n=1 Tax=Novosphingobium sp. TaxID=1874826 RepID=UPI00261BB2B5|nr:amidohydrolase family protein [Novosphingobium sp.]